jgi:hypothetical protein
MCMWIVHWPHVCALSVAAGGLDRLRLLRCGGAACCIAICGALQWWRGRAEYEISAADVPTFTVRLARMAATCNADAAAKVPVHAPAAPCGFPGARARNCTAEAARHAAGGMHRRGRMGCSPKPKRIDIPACARRWWFALLNRFQMQNDPPARWLLCSPSFANITRLSGRGREVRVAV